MLVWDIGQILDVTGSALSQTERQPDTEDAADCEVVCFLCLGLPPHELLGPLCTCMEDRGPGSNIFVVVFYWAEFPLRISES